MSTRKDNRGASEPLGRVAGLLIDPEENRAAAISRLQEIPYAIEALNWFMERLKPEWLIGGELYLHWDSWVIDRQDEDFVEFHLCATHRGSRRLHWQEQGKEAPYKALYRRADTAFPEELWESLRFSL